MAANTRSEAISGTNLDVNETTDTHEIQLITAAINNPHLAAFMTGDLNSIHYFLVHKNVDQELTHGFTPLMIASLHGQFEAVKLLVDEGADVNKTCENKTALMLAATISSFELERVCTRRTLLPVTSEIGGDTLFTSSDSIDDKAALLKRILENKTKIIEFLLQAGADPSIRDESGRNALIFVTANSFSKCFGSMFQGSVPVMIQTVANTELVKRCQYLIKHGVDINTTDSDRMTALMHAVRNRLDNVCELLLDHKADVDIVDNNENTALIYSVLTGSKYLSRLLVQCGAKLLTRDDLRRVVPSQDLLEKSCDMCKLLNGSDTNMDISNVNETNSEVCCQEAVRNQTQRTTSDNINSSLYPISDDLNNDLGHVILLSAVTKKSFEVCKFALDHGANPNTKNNDDKTVLMHAILVRSVDICNLLLNNGAEPHVGDAVCKTALMYAVSQDLPEVANLLISSGADVNLQDVTGKTALMCAIIGKVDGCCQLLLRHGADVNIQNNIGRTAIIFAVATNYDCSIQWLIENKGDLNVQDVKGRTALMYAAINNSTHSCKLLVESKADLNIQDKYGMTAALHCAEKSLLDPLRVLLTSGANPDLCDNKGMSALMYTVVNNSPDCCKLLVDHEANINLQDPAVMFSATATKSRNLKELPKILVSDGANLEIKDKKGHTALWHAVLNNRPEIFKLLVHHGADVNCQDSSTGETLVMLCLGNSPEDYLDILLTGKPDLNLMDKEHKTVLMKASCLNLPSICEILVCHGADVNIQDRMGMSAMMYAVWGNSYESVKYFLSLGVDPNKQMGHAYVPHDNDDGDGNATLQGFGKGKSAFQFAVILDRESQCRLMMSYGAEVNKKDRDGRTALMYAVLHDSSRCFPLLVECADLSVEDNEGRTVMSYATTSDYIQKLQEMGLEDRGAGEKEKVSVLSLLMANVNFFTQLPEATYSDARRAMIQVESVLENGASPILEPSERSLLHKCNISLSPSPDFMKCFHIQWCITQKRQQFLRLLVCNGVVRASGSQSSTYRTVFQAVLECGAEDIFKYLIANCYLTDEDVAYMRNPGRRSNPGRIRYTLPEQMFQQPWPLVKLAFISVSTALGGGPGREARVSKTGLPVKLQDMLMFRQPAAQIPAREWADIELCFDPVMYEELPSPRPLLYYWPLGRQV